MQQRRCRGNGEYCWPGSERETRQQPPTLPSPNRRRVSSDAKWQAQRGKQHHAEVHENLLSVRHHTGEHMGVSIAEQERCLKEDQTSAPDRRRATESREHHSCHHRLDQEHQAGAEKEGRGEQQQDDAGRLRTNRSENSCRQLVPQHSGSGPNCPRVHPLSMPFSSRMAIESRLGVNGAAKHHPRVMPWRTVDGER